MVADPLEAIDVVAEFLSLNTGYTLVLEALRHFVCVRVT
jgi:hypothetical protein